MSQFLTSIRVSSATASNVVLQLRSYHPDCAIWNNPLNLDTTPTPVALGKGTHSGTSDLGPTPSKKLTTLGNGAHFTAVCQSSHPALIPGKWVRVVCVW